ncbi:carboxypeptidase regulatory-like domain-containing protein [Fodinibius sp. AD559]|uniref:carboxypeptidase regulatory-like domain-containing protein n=1 Tax=Fodinibius sp. AD559 TaxID=3424179 RepID=UPI004046EF9F
MKNRLLFLFPIAVLLFIQACGADDSVIIAGQVIESESGNPVNQAVVEVVQPENLQQTATTDSSGNFSFDVDPGNETQNISLEASKQGYETQTTNFKMAPDTDVDDLVIQLASTDDAGGDGDEGEDDQVGGEAGGPANMELINLSESTISVRETGGDVNATFTFEVTDSAGRVVDSPVDVNFQIIRGPNGGERITPQTATTGVGSPVGTVKSNLAAGDSSGTVRIEAVIERPDHGITIRSSPVLISISSGFPVKENFHVAPRVNNFDAYGIVAEDHTNSITVSVGDLKGNPVEEGTAVYFSSSNGGLVNGSAVTNENGYATVNLSANGSEPTGHPMGPGFVDVTAQTIDKNNNYIEKTTALLLTTPRADIDINPTTLNISNGGSQTFDVTITDVNGYPMAADTRIEVSTGQGLEASGDIVDLELGDYFQPGPGTTEFQLTISDSDPDEAVNTEGSFTITVTSPFGETTTKSIDGSRAKTQ